MKKVPTSHSQSNGFDQLKMNMSLRDLFDESHVAVSMEFKAWADIHRVKSELDLDLDLGSVMPNFDGFHNISYQCLDQEEIEVKSKTLKTR